MNGEDKLSEKEAKKIYKKEIKKHIRSEVDIEDFIHEECGLIVEEVLNKKFKTEKDIKSYVEKITREETDNYLSSNIWSGDIKNILRDIISEKFKDMNLGDVLDFCNKFKESINEKQKKD